MFARGGARRLFELKISNTSNTKELHANTYLFHKFKLECGYYPHYVVVK